VIGVVIGGVSFVVVVVVVVAAAAAASTVVVVELDFVLACNEYRSFVFCNLSGNHDSRK
jgi:hypothetical protein